MQISKNGLNLITSFEGLSLSPYSDSAGIATIGYGTILYPGNVPVTLNDPAITKDQAIAYLQWEVDRKTAAVNNLVKISINQNQFDALVCFAYNVGIGALTKSTLLRLLNEGNISEAADEFLQWNKVDGIAVSGLTRRREAERSLFLQSVPINSLSDYLSSQTEAKLKDIDKEI